MSNSVICGIKVFWILIALSALLVILPSIFSLFNQTLPKFIGIFLTAVYWLMLLMGLYILLYDFSYLEVEKENYIHSPYGKFILEQMKPIKDACLKYKIGYRISAFFLK